MAVFGGYTAGQMSAFGLVLCWLLVAVLAMSAFALRNRAPRVAFGIAMAFLAFLPTSNILGIGNGPYGDYYLDVSSIGLSILFVAVAAWLLSVSGRCAKIAGAFGAVILLVRICAIAESARWAYLWADGERAYKSTIATFPKAYYGYIVYAQMLCDRDDFAGALAHCDAAERLIGADEEKMRYVNIVRAICVMRGEKDAQKALAWLDKCEKGCSRAPYVRSCHFYRGCVAEDLLNDLPFAQREYESAMPAKLGVDDIRTADRLARIYAINGKVPAAIELWREALRVSPGDYSVAWNLSIALRQTGMIDEANRLQERIDAGIRCPQ
jgi:tetratricopeptide (TPR) repeat protein